MRKAKIGPSRSDPSSPFSDSKLETITTGASRASHLPAALLRSQPRVFVSYAPEPMIVFVG
eukprot:scaffold153799_cov29-Tisochrysis_lutea.AAC.2